MIEARIPNGVQIDRIRVEDLPADWRRMAAREKLQNIGTA